MIEQQICLWDVLDVGVLELLVVVKWEDFVLVVYKVLVFMDMEILFGDVFKGQVMLVLCLEVCLLQEFNVVCYEKVLEVGVGLGFMVVLLGYWVQCVIFMELDVMFVVQVVVNFKCVGVFNVIVLNEDGVKGLLVEVLFDVILLFGLVEVVFEQLLQ